jgi:hypothetical protein
MTFKDLQKLIEQQQEASADSNKEMQDLTRKLQGRPFYTWDSNKHRSAANPNGDLKGRCCLNHILGLPQKNGVPLPLFDYEDVVYRALMIPNYINSKPTPELLVSHSLAEKKLKNKEKEQQYFHGFKLKHVAILKASCLGITEFVLRFMVWLCLRNDDLKGSQMVIFTGPRLDLAISLINRIKDLFKPHGITFTDKETVVNLNGVRIEAFPSHHADSARGLPNVSLIFADECSFFPDREKDNVMDIMIRNVPKSNPYLIAVSTPNKPGDLMDQIMKQPFDSSPFKKVFLDWSYGIDKIYDKLDIDKIKNSRSFEREFCLKFAGLEGNVLSQTAIDRCIKLGEEMNKTAPIDN